MSQDQYKIVTAVSDGSLHEKADLKSYVLRDIEQGDKLELIGKQGNFYQVKKRIGFDSELTGFVDEKLGALLLH